MLRPRYLRTRARLDQKITIMRSGPGTDAMNEPIASLVEVFSTRAEAYPAPGFERSVGDQMNATMVTAFEVRDEERTRMILPSDKVRWDNRGGQLLNIVAPVEQPERGRNLRILAAADTGGQSG